MCLRNLFSQSKKSSLSRRELIVRDTREMEARACTLTEPGKAFPDALPQPVLKAVDLDSPSVTYTYRNEEDKLDSRQLGDIPKQLYKNIVPAVSPFAASFKLYDETGCHILQLNLSNRLYRLKEYQTRETIEVHEKGRHVETIERTTSHIAINDVTLEKILADHSHLPNAKAVLDFYQHHYAEPHDALVWKATAQNRMR